MPPSTASSNAASFTREILQGPGAAQDAFAAVGLPESDREAGMALARVVTFEGVGKERIEELGRQMREDEPPEGLDASEVVVLHDPAAEQSVVILFFENEDDYTRADEVLNAMPAGDTPGRRASVAKYDVAVRMTR
jgi:hypothetical protein